MPDGERNRDPYDDDGRATYDDTDRAGPSGVLPFGFPTSFGRDATDHGRDSGYDEGYEADDGTSYRREVARGDASAEGGVDDGIIGVVVVAGIALFLFPEPATSVVGLALVVAGVVAWLAGRKT